MRRTQIYLYGKHFFIIINFIIIMIIIYSAQLSHISLTIIMNKYTYILYHFIFDHQIVLKNLKLG